MTTPRLSATSASTGRIASVFQSQFDAGLHPAASVAVYVDGRLEFERIAGALAAASLPADRNTLFRVFSCGKPLAAACLWLLKDRGLLSWDDPVAKHWPEFAAGGKDAVKVRQVLSHTAGLPHTPRQIGQLDYVDWGSAIRKIEDAPLEYEPGDHVEYHEETFGWIVGELVARISLRPFTEFFRDEVAWPLGLTDTFFSLTPLETSRVAKLRACDGFERPDLTVVFNNEASCSIVMPAFSTLSTARDIARFYSVLIGGGRVDGRQWLSAETIAEATSQHAEHIDPDTGRRSSAGLGVWLAGSEPNSYGAPDGSPAFGHGGLATCVAWGDPDSGIAAAYLTTGMQPSETDRQRLHDMSRAIRAEFAANSEPRRHRTHSATPEPLPLTFPGEEWSTAEPEEVGMNRARLAAAGQWQAEDANNRPYRVLIARHGRIVAEWNFRIDPLEQARQASASKSTYSCVLGVAVQEGVIGSADDRVVDYYPEMRDVPPGRGPKEGRHWFPENEGITFRQLIGNTSGYMKPGEAPGRVFNYQTFGMNVLTHAVAAAYSLYKTKAPERGGGFGTLTEWKIRNPIGGTWSWVYGNFDLHPDANQAVFGYNTSYLMTPRDMARVGLLWLRGGEWNGVQVVPRDWLQQATRVNDDILANEPEANHVYGLGFWCNDRGMTWPDLPRDSFAAMGAGRQHIWVCPSLDLIVVQSPGSYLMEPDVTGAESRRYMQNLLGRIAEAAR